MLKELCEDLSSIKKVQSETKNTPIKMQNNLRGNNSRLDEAENQINDLEYKESKHNQNNKKKKESPQNEDSVSNLWDFKHSKIHIIRLSEE